MKKPLLGYLVTSILVGTALVLLWLFVLDTISSRRITSWRIRQIANKAIADPNDWRYATRLLSIAKGNWHLATSGNRRFAACKAAQAIGDIGEPAKSVVVELAGLLQSPDAFLQRSTAEALAQLGPVSEPALDALEEQVAHGDPLDDTTWFSAEAIGRIGRPARRLLPLLRKKLGTGNDQFDYSLRQAIANLEGGGKGDKSNGTNLSR
jgi:HEAT repeat protein